MTAIPPTLDGLVAGTRRSGWSTLALIVVGLLAAFVVWAAQAQLDEVVTATGEVVPRSQVKVVQHLEGGIVQALAVSDGDIVSEGQPLLELTLPTTSLNLDELGVRMAGLRLTAARLRAELADAPLILPEAEALAYPILAEGERQAYTNRRDQQGRELAALDAQAAQRRHQIDELLSTRASVEADLALSRDNLRVSTDLVRDRLVSQLEHNARKREVARLEGELTTLASALPRAEQALGEAEEMREEARLNQRQTTLNELQATEGEIARIAEVLKQATEQQNRTVLRAPVDGVVKNLRVHTIGGVVRPAEPLMEIVPIDDVFIIEAKLAAADRGVVEAGAPARAKITAYDFLRFGTLDGRIERVSTDSTVDADGVAYFNVVMRPDANSIGEGGDAVLVPGMIAQVDIHVGERSLLVALTEPFARVRSEAFRERN